MLLPIIIMALTILIITLIVSLISFASKYKLSKEDISRVTLNSYETGTRTTFTNDQTRNVTMTFKEFEPLYKGSPKDWTIARFHDETVFVPYYTGLFKTENKVYFIHFRSIFDYLKLCRKYNPNKDRDKYNEEKYSRIVNDVSSKIQERLTKIQQEREKALEQMGETLSNVQSNMKLNNDFFKNSKE